MENTEQTEVLECPHCKAKFAVPPTPDMKELMNKLYKEHIEEKCVVMLHNKMKEESKQTELNG